MSIFSSHKTIQVTPDQLREQAGNLHLYADDAGDIFNQMEQHFLALNEAGAWEGLAFDEASKATAMNVSRFEGMESNMHHLADLMDAVADKMQNTDLDIQSRINAAYTH